MYIIIKNADRNAYIFNGLNIAQQTRRACDLGKVSFPSMR